MRPQKKSQGVEEIHAQCSNLQTDPEIIPQKG